MPASAQRSCEPLLLRVDFFPRDKLLFGVLRLVSDFCTMVVSDEELRSRFYMAAHELAENVAKYSTGPHVSLELQVDESDDRCVMRIIARNETSPDRLREVERRLFELKNAKDPISLYDKLIRETALTEGISGLGLARLRAEGQLEIDYRIDGDVLTVIAHAQFKRSGETT